MSQPVSQERRQSVGHGLNNSGQLGDGTYNQTNRPETDCGQQRHSDCRRPFHSLFLKSDGSLWAMGDNTMASWATALTTDQPARTDRGQQCHGDCRRTITACFSRATAACGPWARITRVQLGDGTFNNTNRPEQIVASDVTAIAAGWYHSLFLKSDGSLWAMGANMLASWATALTALPNSTNRPEQIVAAYGTIESPASF